MSGTAILAVGCAAILLLWPVPRERLRLRAAASAVGPSRTWRSGQSWVVAAGTVAGCGAVAGVSGVIAGGLLACLVLWLRRRRGIERQAAADDELLTQALAAMVAELSVGAAPERAAAAAAADLAGSGASPRIPDELARMAAQAQLGGAPILDDELRPGMRSLGQAWTIAAEHGLALADLLDGVRADLIARRDFAERTRASLAGPRATALVLAGLPLLGIALGEAMGADPIGVLLSPGIGPILLVAGTTLVVSGVAWAEQIITGALR